MRLRVPVAGRDAALARRMIDKIALRGPDSCRLAAPGVPAVIADCRLAIIGPEAGTQPIWRGDDVLIANGKSTTTPICKRSWARRASRPQRQRDHPPSVPRSAAALDRPARRHVRLRAGDARARDRGARPARHQADLCGASRRRPGLRSELKAFDGLGLHEARAIAPGALLDSEGACGAGSACPRALPSSSRGCLRSHLARVAPGARGGGEEMAGRRRRGRAFLSGGVDSSIIAALAARLVGARSRPSRSASRAAPISRRAAGRGPHRQRASRAELHRGRTCRGPAPCGLSSGERRPRSRAQRAADHFATTLRGATSRRCCMRGRGRAVRGYAYHHAYAGRPRRWPTRSPLARHDAQHQPAAPFDRITMAQGLEARTPFLDRDLIAFAQSIPAALKIKAGDQPGAATIEKSICARPARTCCRPPWSGARRPSSTRAPAPSPPSTRRSAGRAASRRRSRARPKAASTSACCAISTPTRT